MKSYLKNPEFMDNKGTGKQEQTMEERVKEILGLEVSPHGEPNFFLIRDSEGNILEGMDFSDEVEQLEELVSLAVQQERERIVRMLQDQSMHAEVINKTLGLGNHYSTMPVVAGITSQVIKAINQDHE